MILLTGGSGFTGKFVIAELLERKIPFKCLIRNKEQLSKLKKTGINCVLGDVNDPDAWEKALPDCDGIINIVSFNQDHVSLLLEQARKNDIKRTLFISTTAIFTKLTAKSKILRTRIEKEITSSDSDWTILRPTMIYGAPGDRNMERLIKAVKKFPIHPVLGSGKYMIQPLFVKDLSKAIVDAYLCPKAYKKAYNLSGGQAISYLDCVRQVAKALKKKILLIPLPVKLAYILAEICYRLPFLPNVKSEQVLRLNEDKTFAHEEAARDFDFSPANFEDAISSEIKTLLL